MVVASSPPPQAHAALGVIGGSGFYSLLDDVTEVPVATPYGEPSDPLAVGTIGERRVAFLARHGRDHRYPPHRINYRANMWALHWAGVRQVIAPCAVGSLRAALGPGSLVVPDQLVDRTTGRVQTYYDRGAAHVAFADPYCPTGRLCVLSTARAAGWQPTNGGTMVVVEGPRFSTRAESRWFADQGWALVNMTGHPEAVLARELALCYTAVALVTDLDAGAEHGEGVSMEKVFRIFGESMAGLREVVLSTLQSLPAERTCPCPDALEGMDTSGVLP
ncbi:MAG: S-methyl-5'-thioadenosine phosphorylase [Actinomycetes bacterium]